MKVKISSLMKDRRALILNVQNAGYYFIGSIVQSFFALITQPIYSKHLSAEEFGVIGYFDAIKSFFVPVFILSLSSVYLMHFFKQSEEENKKMLFNFTFNLLLINTITVFIAYLGIYFYFIQMGVKIPLNPFAWYILVALLLDNIKSVVLINYRIRKKALSFLVFSVINMVLNVGLGLLFVAIFKWGAEGRMLAPIISTLIILPYCIYILKKYTSVYFNFNYFIKNLKIAFPLIFASYAYVPITIIDRIYLERLNNISEMGLYNIGITIAGYVQLAYVALALAFEPDIFKAVAQKNFRKLFKVFLFLFIPFGSAVILFIFSSDFIINFLTSGRYLGAKVYTNVAVISVFLMGIYWYFDKIFVALGKTKINLYVNIFGSIFSIIIIYYCVDTYKFIGAAYGKVITSALIVIFSGFLLNMNLKKAYN